MKTTLALALALLATSSMPLLADGMGTQVTGTAVVDGFTANYFDAANGLVPTGYGNSGGATAVEIGAGTEFGLSDGVITYSANFSGNQLVFSNTDTATWETENPITFTFSDTAFRNFSLVSNSADVSYGFSGDTLTLSTPGGIRTGTAVFDYNNAVTPEPSSWVLLGTGLLGMAGSMRRRVPAV